MAHYSVYLLKDHVCCKSHELGCSQSSECHHPSWDPASDVHASVCRALPEQAAFGNVSAVYYGYEILKLFSNPDNAQVYQSNCVWRERSNVLQIPEKILTVYNAQDEE